MDKQELINLLLTFPSRSRAKKTKMNQSAVELLDKMFPGVSINSQIYCLLHEKSPYCTVCKKILLNARKNTCSISCRTLSTDYTAKISKQKQTLLDKYGVENIRNIPGAEEKRKSTLVEKYNSLVSPKTKQKAKERAPLLISKGRKTLMKKYKVTNPGQLPNHRKKCADTLLKKTGVDHPAKIPAIIEKKEIDRLNNYIQASPDNISIIQIHEPTQVLKEQYIYANRRIEFFCKKCNISETIPSETFKFRMRSTGTCCSKCGGITTGSIKENELRNYIIEELGIEVKSNDRIILDNQEIDILIANKNIGIEFNGLYWHNDLLLPKNYHLCKSNLAKEKNIMLIHVFEDEWMHKKEIVKNRIRHLLNLSTSKVFARKCQIRTVKTKEERDFLNDNHIQGYAPSAIKLGLYYKDELISIMTFSRPNISKGHKNKTGYWELLRFCSKKEISVVGAAGKLFSHFIKTNNPEQVMSFSDKRWGKGDLYPTLGFEFAGDTEPNYWYVDLSSLRRIHRFSLRKNNKDEQSLTEIENRRNQGYLRIWDCGSSKWVWKRAE
jgi:hypothetical protein